MDDISIVYSTIKRYVAWPLTWMSFCVGHVISKCMHIPGLGWLYRYYHILMCVSVGLQEWALLDEHFCPWKTHTEEHISYHFKQPL